MGETKSRHSLFVGALTICLMASFLLPIFKKSRLPKSSTVPSNLTDQKNLQPPQSRILAKSTSAPNGVPQQTPKVSLNRKASKINYHVFQHAQIPGIPEALKAKQHSKRFTWLLAVLATNVACFVHLYFLLNSFVTEPNQTTVTFEPQNELRPPRVFVCQPSTRMLDPKSVANISAEYYFALELGVGLIRTQMLGKLQYSMNITQVKEQNQKILRDHNGSAAAAYKIFHQHHMRKCEDVFDHCYTELFTRINCCDIFEPVFTLYGMCYVSKNNSVVITGSDSLANFRFRLKFTGSTRPNFLPNNILDELPRLPEAYDVGFVDGLDQGNFLVEHELVLPDQWLTVNMAQKLNTLMYNNKKCLDNDVQLATLNYFQEYTRSNCRWERALLQNLQCELPLVQLLNPDYKASAPCNLSQIMEIFEYKQDYQLIIEPEFIKKMNKVLKANYLEYINNSCNLFHDGRKIPNCTLETLLTIGLDEEANNYLIPFLNSHPKSLEKRLGEYLKQNKSEAESCLPLCYSVGHNLKISKEIFGRNLEEIFDNEASVILQYTTKDVTKVVEGPKQSIAEYLAQVGGNIGMWNGASLLAIGHLLALGFDAIGVGPFRQQP